MALALLNTGLTRVSPGASDVTAGLLLGATILAGALVFGAIVLLAWLMSGRPQGAETYLLGLSGQVLRRWVQR
jgi:hypothetical protein